MTVRALILILFAVLPGSCFAGFSAYTLFPEWAALTASHQRYMQVANSSAPTAIDLSIAQAAETRHRLNCFAEGVGVLLGNGILAIGLHGLCTLPQRAS
jgi:hypothetical protein